jgi:dihydropteroate synthase
MLPLVAETGAGLVLMHMQGTPRTMQQEPRYGDVVAEVRGFLEERLGVAAAAGIDPGAVVLDPGIGFGKTLEHNLALLRALPDLEAGGRPLLLGVSRKRWLGELTGRAVEDRLAASLAGLAVCIQRGAKIMRVHDVIESCDTARILDRINQQMNCPSP